jgi:diacylglycerol kinase family enzyme
VRIGLLNNLRAGRSNPEVRRILHLLKDYPDVAHIETTSVRSVPEALASLARQDVELLVVNGGDGTLQYTLTQILTTDDFPTIPMVAPLRGGRTNMSALDLGAHRNPVKGLQGLLEDVKAGRIEDRLVDRPLLRVETLRDRGIHYGFFFGAGMIHRAIDLTHNIFPQGRSQGSFGAGLVTAGLILRAIARRRDGVLLPDKAQIRLDGELIEGGEFTLIIASSLQRLFLRINPFWGDEDAPVRFTAMASGSKRTALAAPGILRGKPSAFVKAEMGYTSRNVKEVELRIDAGFTVDGETIQPRSGEIVRISGDRRIRFVRA